MEGAALGQVGRSMQLPPDADTLKKHRKRVLADKARAKRQVGADEEAPEQLLEDDAEGGDGAGVKTKGKHRKRSVEIDYDSGPAEGQAEQALHGL